MTKKYFFQVISIWVPVSKNIEFYVELKSTESIKKDYQRKLSGWDLLYTVLTTWKSSWFLHFNAYNFLRRNFLQFFKRIRNQHKILRFFTFLTSISKFFVKISEGHVSANFEAEQGHNGSKNKTKILNVDQKYIFQFWFRTTKLFKIVST